MAASNRSSLAMRPSSSHHDPGPTGSASNSVGGSMKSRGISNNNVSHHRKTSSLAATNAAVLASLRNTKLVSSTFGSSNGSTSAQHVVSSATVRAALPAEIFELVLDYLPIPDLFTFAQTARRMKEMVYEDAVWIKRLRLMGIWDEVEARRRADADRQATTAVADKSTGANGTSTVVGKAHQRTSSTLFDAGAEEVKLDKRRSIKRSPVDRSESGFDKATVVAGGDGGATTSTKGSVDVGSALNALSRVRSIRGQARQEYAKVYQVLQPFYRDISQSAQFSNPLIFKSFQNPEDQAQMLASVGRLARSDCSMGWEIRQQKLNSVIGFFETAALREYQQGMVASDVDGRMRRYAHILVTLNGGRAAVDAFVRDSPVMFKKDELGDPLDCIRSAFTGHINMAPSELFFTRLAGVVNEQAKVINKSWPMTVDVMTPFINGIVNEIIAEYVRVLVSEARAQSAESYLKAVSGVFHQALRFCVSVKPAKSSPKHFTETLRATIIRLFELYVDHYLREELGFFERQSDQKVYEWEQRLAQQEQTTESFYMSNVSRQAAKQDFMSSFKKMVMFPVTAVGSLTTTSSSASKKQLAPDSASVTPRASTPVYPDRSGAATPSLEAPTTELAAKAAIMNSRLEGIRTLFSIEVALNLVHSAKASIERAAVFAQMGGRQSVETKKQCEAIFVSLLTLLGQRHIKQGFDKAVSHLNAYNPRESGGGAEPLVTFLELVSVGDLIQQMVDVFYMQELVASKLSDDNDFLSQAVKEKKRFESMLDERVAAGLNKGIDVLMDELEFICGSTQKATEFNPLPGPDGKVTLLDIGPTDTAKQVVDVVAKHVGMLVGSADKNVLDVFNQEVGVRLFTVLCKHIKRQRISVDGAIRLISDANLYHTYITSMRNRTLNEYFSALRELMQIYLVDASDAKEIGAILADGDRYRGIFTVQEVIEFAERRADWFVVRKKVEKAMYGMGCCVM